MKVLWWRQEIVCQQWVELVTAYLEGALPHRTTRAIDRHLAACEHCTEYLAQMRATIRLAGQLPEHDVPADVMDALSAAFAELHPPDEPPRP
jgi:anti-sigma factor RsiW